MVQLPQPPTREELLSWLRETDPLRLEDLWRRADDLRRAVVGDEVQLRGLIEISNHCRRSCTYCGIRQRTPGVTRYRMTQDQIVASAIKAARFGYGTVVLQAGEDPALTTEWVTKLVRRIKTEAGVAITLSLGERPRSDLVTWKAAGADRYLIRFETSDPVLFARIHPKGRGYHRDRFEMLADLRALGFEVGSGVMVGIPGQTFETLADDLLRFRALDLDMIGLGPFIASPHTPLWRQSATQAPAAPDQVPADELTTYKVLALARLLCPQANLPATTALATLNTESGRETGLQRGANVLMPNVTPPEFRLHYEIYPAKACITETAEKCNGCMKLRISSIGRKVGRGPGGRQRTATTSPATQETLRS
jgi:biotin synthase